MANAFLTCTPNTGGAISTWSGGGTPSTDGFECVVTIPAELAGATFDSVSFSYTGSGSSGTKNVRYTGTGITVTNANLLEKLQNGETTIRIYFSFKATGSSGSGSGSYTWRDVTCEVAYTPAAAVSGTITAGGSVIDYSINAAGIQAGETALMTLSITPSAAVSAVTVDMGDSLHTAYDTFTASVSIAAGATGTAQLTLAITDATLSRRTNPAYFRISLAGAETSDWTQTAFVLYRVSTVERKQHEGRMIIVYSPEATSFDTLGLAVLRPKSCTVKQVAGAEYALKIEHPITDDGTWQYITEGAIIKAPIPPESIPNLSIDSGDIIIGEVDEYRTTTQTARYSDLGQPTTRRVTYQLWHADQLFYPGNKVTYGVQNYECVTQNSDTTFNAANWKKISNYETYWSAPTVADYTAAGTILYASVDPNFPRYLKGTDENGNSGWWVLANCEYIGAVDPGEAEQYLAKTIIEQTFRITNVVIDSDAHTVTADAEQTTYDYAKMAIPVVASVEGATPQAAAAKIRESAAPNGLPYPPVIACDTFDGETVTADWSHQNVAFSILDPDDGLVPQCHARLVRDVWNFFVLKNDSPNRGYEIGYGRNLKGVTWSRSVENLITRIYPRAKAANGDPLYYDDGSGNHYVDSPLAGDYTFARCECMEIKAQVGKQNPEGQTYTEAMVQEEMLKAAQERFAAEFCDAVTEDVKIDFLKLGDTEEYRQYRNLERISIYDTVAIRHPLIGLAATAQVREYEWDAVKRRFISITLGNIWTYGQRSVVGYEIANGCIRLSKLAPDVISAINS